MVPVPVEVMERLAAVLERLERMVPGAAPAVNGLLTTDDVAVRLGKSPRDVQRLVKAGKLRKVPNLGKRTTRFRPVDVERFLSVGELRAGARRL